MSYQQQLQSFYDEDNIVPVLGGFKRHIEVSPTNDNMSAERNFKKKRKRYDHKNDPSFLLPGHS